MYCWNCGKELNENAYVCTGCGVLANSKPVVKSSSRQEMSCPQEEVYQGKKRNKAFWVLFWISFGAVCLSFMLCLIGIAESLGSIYEIARWDYNYYYYCSDCSIAALIVSILSHITAVIQLIVGLTKKEKLTILAVINLIISATLLIANIVFVA